MLLSDITFTFQIGSVGRETPRSTHSEANRFTARAENRNDIILYDLIALI